MKIFIIMPFSPKYEILYTTIKNACKKACVDYIRADEIKEPGVIINQIFDGILNSDYVIAEVSDKNANVYYEIGIAHSAKKPTILLANKEIVETLPFDIRHNRVLTYDRENLNDLEAKLIVHLKYFNTSFTGKNLPTATSYLEHLNFDQEKVIDITKGWGLIDPKIVKFDVIPEGLLLVIKDPFDEKVTILIDVNGIITKFKREEK